MRVYRVMDVRGNFGEHERSVLRVARDAAKNNPSCLSALHTSQVHASITRYIYADLNEKILSENNLGPQTCVTS